MPQWNVATATSASRRAARTASSTASGVAQATPGRPGAAANSSGRMLEKPTNATRKPSRSTTWGASARPKPGPAPTARMPSRSTERTVSSRAVGPKSPTWLFARLRTSIPEWRPEPAAGGGAPPGGAPPPAPPPRAAGGPPPLYAEAAVVVRERLADLMPGPLRGPRLEQELGSTGRPVARERESAAGGHLGVRRLGCKAAARAARERGDDRGGLQEHRESDEADRDGGR